jgi:hypothetical protein
MHALLPRVILHADGIVTFYYKDTAAPQLHSLYSLYICAAYGFFFFACFYFLLI